MIKKFGMRNLHLIWNISTEKIFGKIEKKKFRKEDPGLGSYVGAISAISRGVDRMGPNWVGKWGDPIGSLWTPEETFGYFEIFGKSIFLAKNGHISAPCGPNPLKFGYVICPSVGQLSINRPSPSMNFAKNRSGQKLALGGPKMPLKPWNHKIC